MFLLLKMQNEEKNQVHAFILKRYPQTNHETLTYYYYGIKKEFQMEKNEDTLLFQEPLLAFV